MDLTPTHLAFNNQDVNPVPTSPLVYDIATVPSGLVFCCCYSTGVTHVTVLE